MKRLIVTWIVTLVALAGAFDVYGAPAKAPDEPPDPALIELLSRTMADQTDQPDHFDAQVWLMATEPKVERYVADRDERMEILTHVYREASRQKIDVDLVLAVIQ